MNEETWERAVSYTHLESFRNSVSDMWDNIKETISNAWTIIWDNTLKPGFEDVQNLFDSLGKLWSAIYEAYESSGAKALFEKIVVFLGNTLVMVCLLYTSRCV